MAKGKPTFEDALQQIEKIVEAIEGGKVGIEESIRQFDEGMKLIDHCRAILSDAEMKIQKLQAGAGRTLEAAPMASPAEDPESDDETTLSF